MSNSSQRPVIQYLTPQRYGMGILRISPTDMMLCRIVRNTLKALYFSFNYTRLLQLPNDPNYMHSVLAGLTHNMDCVIKRENSRFCRPFLFRLYHVVLFYRD